MKPVVRKYIIACVALCASTALPGCYSRTIESKGLGTRWEQRDIYKPNVEKKVPEDESKKSGGFFNSIGEFFFGSDDG